MVGKTIGMVLVARWAARPATSFARQWTSTFSRLSRLQTRENRSVLRAPTPLDRHVVTFDVA